MKFVEWIKPRFEIINFVVITFLLLLSCFFEFAVLLCVIYAICVSVFYNKQQILCLYLYLKCFENTFNTTNINFVGTIIQGLFGIFVLKYIIELIKNRSKLYLPTLIPIIIFLIYIILPNHIVEWWNYLHTTLFMLAIYILSCTKEKISLSRLSIIYGLGLIISCSFSLLRPLSSRLQEILFYEFNSEFGLSRFAGFFFHPNTLAIHVLIGLSMLLIVYYKNQISSFNFFALFVPLFCFGYIALSRNFIVALSLSIIIFAIFYILKYKKKALKFLLIAFGICLVIVLSMFSYTKLYLQRFNLINFDANSQNNITVQFGEILTTAEQEELPPKFSDEWWQMVYDGKIHYDPGRKGIWQLYLSKWKQSPTSILFGYGKSAPDIGRMSAHNLLLSLLYKYGLVGVGLIIWIILAFLLQFKINKNKLPYLIILIPILFISLFEALGNFWLIYMFSILIFKNFQNEKLNVELQGV